MPLNSLKQIPASQATAILAEAALFTNPWSAEGRVRTKWPDKVMEVISEIRTTLSILPDDESPAARRKIDDAISSALDEAISATVNLEDVAVSLGARGLMPVDAYNIVFHPGAKRFGEDKAFIKKALSRVAFEDLYVNKTHRDQVLNGPRLWQHLRAQQFEKLDLTLDLGDTKDTIQGGSAGVGGVGALMSAKVNNRRGGHHWLLVEVWRLGLTLEVTSVWRIFPEVVGVVNATDSLSLFKVFAEQYGFELEIEGVNRGRFAHNVRLQSYPHKEAIKVLESAGREYFFSEVVYPLPTSGALISTCVAIDKRRYLADRSRYA